MRRRANVYDGRDRERQTIEEIGRVLSLVYRKQYEMIGERLKAIGLSALHSVVLTNVYRYPGLNQNELANLISIDKATVSRILTVLDSRDFLKRPSDEEDRRYKKLYLSESGEAMVRRSMEIQVGMWLELLRDIPQSERVEIMKGLRRLGECFGF